MQLKRQSERHSERHSEFQAEDNRLRKPSKKMTIFVISLAACWALFISSVLWTPFFRLQTLTFTPSDQISEDILLEQMGIFKGKSVVFLLSKHRLEQALMLHPYIEEVKIEKNMPSGLTLELAYREPFFTIFDSGFYILLDDALKVLSVADLKPSAVSLSGFKFKEFKIGQNIKVEKQALLERTVSLVKLMKMSHLEFENRIELIDDGVFLYTTDGISGNFGDVSNVETRFNHFVEIYENLKQKGTTSGLIDVSTEGLPTFKPFGN
jgi:cell division protein FtsQ